MESRIPVTIPFIPLRSVTSNVVRQKETPNARDASRSVTGTILSCSSVVRRTIGIMIKPRANAPARAEKPCIGTTIRVYATRPVMMEGTPERTSALKRIMLARRLPSYSER